jgi:hypothetical protein
MARVLSGTLLAVAALAASGIPAGQAIELLQRDGLTVEVGIEVGAGYFHTENTNFGAGRFDLRTGENTGDAQWSEGYIEPSFGATFESERAGTAYGLVSGVGATTFGDGDAGGFTDDGDESISIERLYAGWRSGALLADSLGENALDLSAGRQDFHVGDGFLIWDGNFETEGEGAYWLGPRTAFSFAGLARVNTSPLGGQLFYLRSDADHGHAEGAGVNLDFGLGDYGLGDEAVLGATYLQFVDVDARFEAETPRDGMQLATVRLNDLRLPGFADAGLYAEYAREFGDGQNVDFDAQAFYVEPFYEFSWLPWTPTLAYRFAWFSGDPNPDDDEREDFDPLFYDYSRGWGTWVQGEITGEYLLFNSNQANHMVHLSAYPTEEIGIGALYFHFDLEEKNYFGTPVSDRDFADEVNLYVDWTINDHVFVSGLYGVVLPGDAAEEVFGEDDAYHLFQIYAIVTF